MLIKKPLARLFRRYLVGRKLMQPFWTLLFQISLKGMNIGQGTSVQDSGELKMLRDLVNSKRFPKSPVIFDVGAHFGEYGEQVVNVFKNHAILYCFEPSKYSYRILKGNLIHLTNVQTYNIGFSNQIGKALLSATEEGVGTASLHERDLHFWGENMTHEEEVNLSTIDQFCYENKIRRIDLLKLDVEGHELEVLKGANKMIESSCIDRITFEFGGCNVDSRTYFQDFFQLLSPNYSIYRVLVDGLILIKSYEYFNELFTTTNYLAVRNSK